MANTYVQIGSTITVGAGGQASIDFTSIPSTFTDLVLVLSTRCTAAGIDEDLGMRFNGDTTSGNYSYTTLIGTGTSAVSGGQLNASFNYVGRANGSTSTASTFSNQQIYIPNYSVTSIQKSSSFDGVRENNTTNGTNDLFANNYNQTAAISSIKIYCLGAANFVQYSTATLYGIKKN
jgi:hypothetical protein